MLNLHCLPKARSTNAERALHFLVELLGALSSCKVLALPGAQGESCYSHCCLVGASTSTIQLLGSAQDQCTCFACFLPGLGNAEAGGELALWHPFSTEQVLPGGLQPS